MEKKTCDTCAWRENGCDGEEICEHYKEQDDKNVK